MRIMVLAAADVGDLALRLGQPRGMTPISMAGRLSENDDGNTAPDLEPELQGGFILQDAPTSVAQATTLDSLLDALDAPLELVMGIDSTRLNPADATTTPDTGSDPVWDYYRERGLLRRIRAECEPEDILAAANRCIDDLEQARRPASEDPFSTALQAIAREVPPPVSSEDSGEDEPPAPTPTPSASATRSTSGWKRTAAKKGRLRRQSGPGKRTPPKRR